MITPFRQGLVQAPLTPFLSLASGRVSIVLGTNQSIIMTMADGSTDYLVTISQPVNNAWQGIFLGGTDYWLYFDTDIVTGQLSYNSTLYMPYVGATPPPTPRNDQHWYNTVTNQMFVFTGGSNWVKKIRVFAAKLSQGTTFISVSINSPIFAGTQVGNTVQSKAGAIVYDGYGLPIKKSDGTFFTTEDIALTGISNSSQVKLGSITVDAVINSNIAPYTIVRFTNFDTVSPATNFMSAIGSYGMVETSAGIGDLVQITMEGLVTNLEWDWSSAGVNAPLYIDGGGQLTTTVSPSGAIIATVVGVQTVLLLSSLSFATPPVMLNVASTTVLGISKLSVPAVTPTSPIVVGDNDPRIINALNKAGDTMTGPLILSGDPTSALGAATKQYVDNAIGSTVSFTVVKQNSDAGAILRGEVCYSSGVGTVGRAQANNPTTTLVIGVCTDVIIEPTTLGNIQTTDILTATTAQWDVITTQVGGLTEGMVYYASATIPGGLTAVPPAVTNDYVVEIGVALSSTQLSINIQQPIKL